MGRMKNSAQVPHRPGPLVQTNKKHKSGKHRSKGVLDSEVRGRVSLATIKKKFKNPLPKAARRKQAAIDRNHKIQAVLDEKKRLGGMRGAPINVCLIPLSAACNTNLTLRHILDQSKSTSNFLGQCGNTSHVKLNNGKNLTFVVPSRNDFWTCLDIMKLSDVVLFYLPILEPLSDEALTLLKCAKNQGMSTPFLGVAADFTKAEEKAFLKSVHRFLPLEKIYPMVNPGQIANLLRMLTVTKVSIPKQYTMRSGMLIENCQVIHGDEPVINQLLPSYLNTPSEPLGQILHVTGYVRRRNLNPYSYVHITGAGTYQILRVDVNPIQNPWVYKPDDFNAAPPRFIYDPNNIPEELRENEEAQDNDADNVSMASDDLSDVDSEMDAESQDSMAKQRRLPKGTSEYQANWLADSDSEKDGDEIFSDNEELESSGSGEDEDEEGSEEDDEMDWDEEQKELALKKAARDEAEFPDWIDTPMDQEAKVRFQRYRGLESFKTSTWNPNENLPKEYSQLFQFQNFRHTHKKILKESLDDGFGFIPVGQRVSMFLRPIDKNSASHVPTAAQSPFVALFSLLRHETRVSVLNLHLNLGEVLKNKEHTLFQVGFHRFQAKPILSDVTPGNKHKMLRFGQQNSSCVATIIGPIVFPTASVLAFKGSNMSLLHVGSGSVSSIDPSRIIVKRILLSGYPFRCNGRKATVRFMFFNREDIEWFKPVELRTRYGRRGHIKEPLGTHGHMKCVFDGQLKSQDTVLMPLYKRVFPKWNYDEYVPAFAIYD